NESALLSALAVQLAVAVQNAQLHERAKQLGDERERALDAERAASKRVRALYEISRSFAQSLSLDATLQAVASTAVDVLGVDVAPIATPAEVLASLTIISVQPGSPVTAETIDQATAIGGQAALAIDNARLYQQQKQFSDMMQRSLLPRSVPELHGLELGDAYESSAHVEVGGDVYDFMELGDGR